MSTRRLPRTEQLTCMGHSSSIQTPTDPKPINNIKGGISTGAQVMEAFKILVYQVSIEQNGERSCNKLTEKLLEPPDF